MARRENRSSLVVAGLALLAAVVAGIALVSMLSVSVRPEPSMNYPRLGRALVALGDAVSTQQAKIVAALLAEDDATAEPLLRAVRNDAIGSVPSAARTVELAARDVFSAVAESVTERRGAAVRGQPTLRLVEELGRLLPIEQRLAADIERHLEAIGGGAATAEELTAQRAQLIADVQAANDVSRRCLDLFEQDWPAQILPLLASVAERDAQLRPLAFVALAALALAFVLLLRRDRGLRGEHAALNAALSAQREGQVTIEAERDQLRQAERRTALELGLVRLEQQSLTESLRSSLLISDQTMRVRVANAASRAAFSLDDGALGLSLLDLPTLEPLLEGLGGAPALATLLAEGRRLHAAELAGPGGRYFEATAVPYVDEAGHVRGLILIADDITAAIETRKRLMQTERLAAMGRLSAQVTHEIRNPLSAIALNADLLDDELDDLVRPGLTAEVKASEVAEAKQLLRAISREVERLTEVTDEYLRLARLRPPSMHPEDIGAIVSELVDFLAEDMRARKVSVRVQLSPQKPLVLADAAQLRQAFMNIIKNSMESMPDGGDMAISSSVIQASRSGPVVRVEVRDNGVGIPEHILARVFDPFYTTKDGGTGLGLPITQQIVAEHGGEVSAESKQNAGTRITVQLPLAKAARADAGRAVSLSDVG